jgi:hypothetical protein
MLTRYKSRRVAALLVLAGVTNTAGLLGAQAPVGGGGRVGGIAPTLIADCDITVQSCGGPPTYEGGGYSGNGGASGSGNSGGCGTGSRVICRTDSYYKCLKWEPVTVSGGVSVGTTTAGGGTTTMVCSESVFTEVKLYWP